MIFIIIYFIIGLLLSIYLWNNNKGDYDLKHRLWEVTLLILFWPVWVGILLWALFT